MCEMHVRSGFCMKFHRQFHIMDHEIIWHFFFEMATQNMRLESMTKFACSIFQVMKLINDHMFELNELC